MAVKVLTPAVTMTYSTVGGDFGGFAYLPPLMYVPKVGLVIVDGSINTGGILAQDGQFAPLCENSVVGGLGFAPHMALDLLSNLFTLSSSQREPVCLSPYQAGRLYSTSEYGGTAVDVTGRSIICGGYYPNFLYYLLPNSGTQYIESGDAGFNISSVGPGRTTTELFLATSNDVTDLRFRFYDSVLKEFTSPVYHTGAAGLAAAYSTDNQNVWVLAGTGPYTLTIVSMVVQPTGLSAVTQVSGSNEQGTVSTFAVTATGAQGEPAPGVLIDWSLSGPGTLLTAQSVTGDNGVAQAEIVIPIGSSGTGTLTASLTC